MQNCSVCEKPIYGHPQVTKGSLVCGSCALSKVKGTPAGKSIFAVQLSMSKAMGEDTLAARAQRTTPMSSLKIKSNFARNRVIMLDGSHPLKFDQYGEASCPVHLRDALDRLMVAKPNRFWIVEDAKPVAVVDVSGVSSEKIEAFKEEWAKAVEGIEEPEEIEVELPKQLDLSYLTEEEEPVPQKKRGPKKKQSKED